MKCLIVIVAVLALGSAQQRFGQPRFGQPRPIVARAAPSSNDAGASIRRYDSELNPDGSYSYSVETDNGIAIEARGTPRDFGGNPPNVPIVSEGSYSFVSPDGVQTSINYVADENGFQPQGDAIPTPPPVPPQIARALEYIARAAPGLRKK